MVHGHGSCFIRRIRQLAEEWCEGRFSVGPLVSRITRLRLAPGIKSEKWEVKSEKWEVNNEKWEMHGMAGGAPGSRESFHT